MNSFVIEKEYYIEVLTHRFLLKNGSECYIPLRIFTPIYQTLDNTTLIYRELIKLAIKTGLIKNSPKEMNAFLFSYSHTDTQLLYDSFHNIEPPRQKSIFREDFRQIMEIRIQKALTDPKLNI